MKKVLISLLAVLLCFFMLAACGGNSQPQQTDDPANGGENEAAQEPQEPEGPVYGTDGADALALLPVNDPENSWINDVAIPDCIDADLQELYKAAWWLFNTYQIGGMNNSLDYQDKLTAGEYNWEYYRDTNFADWATFESAVRAVYTSEFADRFLAVDMLLQGENGGLYSLDGGMGSEIDYVATEFELASETADEIVVNCNSIFNPGAAEAYPDRPDSANDEIRTSELVFKKTDAGWRIDSFKLPMYPVTV